MSATAEITLAYAGEIGVSAAGPDVRNGYRIVAGYRRAVLLDG
jgi:hypothetical protein